MFITDEKHVADDAGGTVSPVLPTGDAGSDPWRDDVADVVCRMARLLPRRGTRPHHDRGLHGCICVRFPGHRVSQTHGKPIMVWLRVRSPVIMLASLCREPCKQPRASRRCRVLRHVGHIVSWHDRPLDLRQPGHSATRIRPRPCRHSWRIHSGWISSDECLPFPHPVAMGAAVALPGISASANHGHRPIPPAPLLRNG